MTDTRWDATSGHCAREPWIALREVLCPATSSVREIREIRDT